MFLVRIEGHKLRLMSFKSNPWLNYDSESENESDIRKKDLFMFKSCIEVVPDLFNFGKESPEWYAHWKKFGRQYSSDKI